RGEWCRYCADIIEGSTYLDRKLLAGIDGHRWRRLGIDREEVFGPVRHHGAAPYAWQTPGGIAAQGLGIVQSRILTLPQGERRRRLPEFCALTRKTGRAVWARVILLLLRQRRISVNESSGSDD